MPNWKAKYENCLDLRRAFQRVVDMDVNNNIIEEHWINKEGLYHRADGAAHILIEENRNLTEDWLQNGLRHRLDGPAQLRWADKSKARLLLEVWHVDGLVSREDGPAETAFYTNGAVKRIGWRHKGQIHRIGGPALCSFLRDGREVSREYWEWNKFKGVEELIDLRKPIPRP